MGYQAPVSNQTVVPDHLRRDYLMGVRLTRQEYDRLNAVAGHQGVSMSDVLRHGLNQAWHSRVPCPSCQQQASLDAGQAEFEMAGSC